MVIGKGAEVRELPQAQVIKSSAKTNTNMKASFKISRLIIDLLWVHQAVVEAALYRDRFAVLKLERRMKSR